MTDPIPEEAVDAAAWAYYKTHDCSPEAPWGQLPADERAWWTDRVRPILTAAAPHIAAQATADLRAGIEALRDEWRAARNAALVEVRRDHTRYEAGELVGRAVAHGGAADALDALLREGE